MLIRKPERRGSENLEDNIEKWIGGTEFVWFRAEVSGGLF
jgi:hypothetical protein